MLLTYDKLQRVVETMPTEFDSHDLISKTQAVFPVEYAEEVTIRKDAADPVLQAHAAIARRLLRLNSLRPQGKVTSYNCRGRRTTNERWKRI